VRCNESDKFTPLLYRARALGAAALCTGHYARITDGPDGQKRLLRAVDASKDQSYFLFGMPRSALDYVRFPLGGLTKAEVRAHALRLKLPNADKPESQEICFVPDGDYAGFVERAASQAGDGDDGGGDILDLSGQVLGRHAGVHRFTVGQRRGLGVAGGAPQYVVRIDAAARQVYIGPREALHCAATTLTEVRWLTTAPPVGSELVAGVQIRYRRRPQPARIRVVSADRAEVEFAEPELAVTPGQAAVFYDGETVLGGGFIASAPAAGSQAARVHLPLL
jgi:tRNA-specific 2-thiouridylase